MTYVPPHVYQKSRTTSHTKRKVSRPAPARRPSGYAELRRRRDRILLVLYATFCFEFVLALFTSPLFAVRHTQIQGLVGLTPEEVEATRHVAFIPPGVNWLRAPVREVEAKLKALPWLREVTVGRKFPNAVGASLSVRQPVVAIQTAFGSYEVDADNTPIRRLRPEMAGRLIPVSLTTTSPVVPGARLYNLGITAAIHIASSPQNRTNVPISKIEVDQSGDIWLNMGNGIRIILGQSDQVDTKITALGRLFNKDPSLGTRVSEINLSCPDWPACRLRVPTPVLTKGNAIASSSERQKHGNHER